MTLKDIGALKKLLDAKLPELNPEFKNFSFKRADKIGDNWNVSIDIALKNNKSQCFHLTVDENEEIVSFSRA